ncbi:MAG: lytic transglycosylase domain-containing protein [Candidatus Sericytochromatia bacterium]
MKSFRYTFIFIICLDLFNLNVYANNIPFVQAVRMSKLKLSQSNKNNPSISFVQAIKMQKQKKKYSNYSNEIFSNSNNYYSIFSNTTDFSNLKSFILKRNPSIGDVMANHIVNEVIKHSGVKGIEPKLIIALMTIESNFNKNAVSPVGAMGLGQLMPETASDLGVTDAYDIKQNVKGTIDYLSQLLKIFKGNLELSLASYNMGPNAVKRIIEQNNDIPSNVKEYVYNIKYIKSII